MLLALRAKGLLGSSQYSKSYVSSNYSYVNNAILDMLTQLNIITTTFIKSKLLIILLNYKQINTYLTKIKALNKIANVLNKITYLA